MNICDGKLSSTSSTQDRSIVGQIMDELGLYRNFIVPVAQLTALICVRPRIDQVIATWKDFKLLIFLIT